jgi:hypothetical protein
MLVRIRAGCFPFLLFLGRVVFVRFDLVITVPASFYNLAASSLSPSAVAAEE